MRAADATADSAVMTPVPGLSARQARGEGGRGFRVREPACNLNLMIKPPVAWVNGLVTGAGKWPSASARKRGGHGEAGESRDVRSFRARWAVA